MKFIKMIMLSISALALLSCSSPQDRAYEAQEGIHNERLELIEKYQECMEDAEGDNLKVEACDQYLKAAEALK